MARSVSLRTGSRKCHLSHSSDDMPGIHRLRSGKGFRYVSARGIPITNRRTLERIRGLVIPPAWQEVWICPSAHGHLQAVGRDDRNRKQYIYHPLWRQTRDENKFDRLAVFGSRLGKLRARLRRDLRLHGLPKKKVLATIVRLLQNTLIRIGNPDYARLNGSFGLTTLRDKHATIAGSRISFQFAGKSGVHHEVEICDRRLAGIVKKCQDLPGQELFQYLDEKGERHKILSQHVNDYLRTAMGKDFTAKDIRTWTASVLANTLLEKQAAGSLAEANRQVVKAVAEVARQLGNTKAVCRRSYLHPAVIEAHLHGKPAKTRGNHATLRAHGLSKSEQRFLRLLAAC